MYNPFCKPIRSNGCRMKRIFLISLFLILGFGGIAQAETSLILPEGFELKVGFFEYPGLTYTNGDGRPAGIVNQITLKTLKHAEIPFSIQSYPAYRFYQSLKEGGVHLFNGVSSIEPVRESTVPGRLNLFPLNMRAYWIGEKPAIEKKADLIGKSVILVRGFTYNDWGNWIRKHDQVLHFDTNTHLSAFRMLKGGRAEYMLNYKYIEVEVLKRIQIPDLRVRSLDTWYCRFNVQKDLPAARRLLERLETSYQELVQSGELKRYE